MPTRRGLSILELVNTAIGNMKDAGIEVGREDIAFLWRIARREASPAEIANWQQSRGRPSIALTDSGSPEPHKLAGVLSSVQNLHARLVQLNFQFVNLPHNAEDA